MIRGLFSVLLWWAAPLADVHPLLGQGGFGRVDEHPRVKGAVIKTEQVAFENALFGGEAEIRENLEAEEPTARALAAAGASPRYFGRAVIGKRRAYLVDGGKLMEVPRELGAKRRGDALGPIPFT